MKTFNSLLAVAMLLLSTLVPPIALAQNTRVLTADKHNEYGLVYSLPITSVRFDIKARHTTFKAGPFFQYAKKYIGTDKVIKENSEKWEILSVTATPVGMPDPDNQYLMQLKPGALTYLCVANDGMLLAINKEVDAPQPSMTEGNTIEQEAIDPKEYLQYVNEDFLASQSSAKQAQMLSESLMEVRDSKISLTRGTAETMPSDGRQLELMLNSLSHQEAAMTAAFIGTTEVESVTRSFTFTPDEEGKSTLFRLSDFAGFVDSDDYSGEPVYINVKVTAKGELPVDSKGEEKKFPKDGVAYVIPGTANISLTCGGRTLWQGDVECSQFGTVFGLQPSIFSDRKARSFATFNPATGALMLIGELNDGE